MRRSRLRARTLLYSLALTAALIAGSGVTPAAANDTAVGGAGGSVAPLEEDGIRMDSETVQIIALRTFAAYRVDFKFINEGPEKTLRLGFPFPQGMIEDGEWSSPHLPPSAVRAWVNGIEIPVTRDEGEDHGEAVEWWVHEVTFPEGETMVRVQYYAAPTVSSGGIQVDDQPARFGNADGWESSYAYTVHTGAGWAGTIGRSVIRYTLTDDADLWGVDEKLAAQEENWRRTAGMEQHAEVLATRTQPQDRVYEWVFEDFEPTYDTLWSSPYDLALPFLTPVPGDGDGLWEPCPTLQSATADSGHLDLGTHSYPARQLVDGYPSTAWAEDADGPGTGEWVRVDFNSPRTVREIRVLPGYAKTAELFEKYNSPRTLEIEFSDGTRTTLDLADEPTVQTFPVSVTAEWAKVTIGEVRSGATRDETYISEIEFAESRAPGFATYAQMMGTPEAPADATDSDTENGSSTNGATPADGDDVAEDEADSGSDSVLPLAIATVVAFVASALITYAIRRRKPS